MTLDATPAGASANSYLTVAGADALAEDDLGPEATGWLDADDVATKERALIRATREVNAYLPPDGSRHTPSQALRFPRPGDLSGGSPLIVRDIELATYHQAIYLHKNHAVLAQANTRRARGMQSASEPNLSYSEGTGEGALAPMALHYLTAFGSAGRGGNVRTMGMTTSLGDPRQSEALL